MLIETFNVIPAVVDDPYVMGKIGYAVAHGGVHSLGLARCSSTRMILGVSDAMKYDERKTIVPMTVRGYMDAAKADAAVKDCQVFRNPWCLFGGTATVVCYPHEIVQPVDATVGDVIVLTKPLGTMVALTVSEWMKQPEKRSRLVLTITEESAERARSRAVDCMARTNQAAAMLMRKVCHFSEFRQSPGSQSRPTTRFNRQRRRRDGLLALRFLHPTSNYLLFRSCVHVYTYVYECILSRRKRRESSKTRLTD